jgi:hypothetical protein
MTTLAALDSLLPLVAPYARACPANVQEQQLRLAASNFALETELWRERLVPILIVEGQREYALALPEGIDGRIKRIQQLIIGHEKKHRNEYSFGPDQVLWLERMPTIGGTPMIVEVVVQPDALCTQYPDWLIGRWQNAIAQGALYFIKSMLDLPWGNEKQAGVHQAAYMRGIGFAKVDNLSGYKNGNVTARLRKFF